MDNVTTQSKRSTIKTTKFLAKIDAEVFAAEQRLDGAEAWVTYECGKGGRFVVTVRRSAEPDYDDERIRTDLRPSVGRDGGL